MIRPRPYAAALTVAAGLIVHGCVGSTPTPATPAKGHIIASIPSPSGTAAVTVEVLPSLDEGEASIRVQGLEVAFSPWAGPAEDLLPQWVDDTRYIFHRDLLVNAETGESDPIRVCFSQQTVSSSLSHDRRKLALSVANGETGTFQVWIVSLVDMSKQLVFEQPSSPLDVSLDRVARWGPDNTLYFVGRSANVPCIYTWQEETGISLPYCTAAYPSPSPDGAYLAYWATDDEGQLLSWMAISLHTGQVIRENPTSGTLTWLSRPGTYAIYQGNEFAAFSVESAAPLESLQLPGPLLLISDDGQTVTVKYLVLDGDQITGIRAVKLKIE